MWHKDMKSVHVGVSVHLCMCVMLTLMVNVHTYSTVQYTHWEDLIVLPSADDEASHQEDEENDSPGDGHSQNGGLVRVPDRKNV